MRKWLTSWKWRIKAVWATLQELRTTDWDCIYYHYKLEQSYHHCNRRFLPPGEGITRGPHLLDFVLSQIRCGLLRLRCDLTDHEWVDTSYGGPDSGDMSGYCKRCGYSFYHHLY